MRTTEIPTDLLVDAVDLVTWINEERHVADNGDVVVTFDQESMEQLEPLIKWFEYIQSTWGAEIRVRDLLATVKRRTGSN